MTPLRLALIFLLIIKSLILAKTETGSRSIKVINTEDALKNLVNFENNFAEVPDFHSANSSKNIFDYESSNNNVIRTYISFLESQDFVQNQNNVIRWKRATSAKKTTKTAKKNLPEKTSPSPKLIIDQSQKQWIDSIDVNLNEKFVQMHAYIVKDLDIPPCNTPANEITNTRYYMCSGAILTRQHVITSATCLNHAEIDEQHVKGKTSALIGGLNEISYVIKMLSYSLHPDYVPDPQENDHALHNIAILTLCCSIPSEVSIIPKLPSEPYDDVSHMCCQNNCKLLTVIENSKNLHLVREMKIKHIPTPIHDQEESIKLKPVAINLEMVNLKNIGDSRFLSSRRMSRNPGIAPIPQFFTQEKLNKSNQKKLKNNKKDVILKSSKDMSSWKGIKQAVSPNAIKSKYDVQLRAAPDEESSSAASADKESVTKSAEDIDSTEVSSNMLSTGSASESASESTLDIEAQTNSSDKEGGGDGTEDSQGSEDDENNEADPPDFLKDIIIEKNVYCPPLGTPVIVNNTLVALIAYTCDDLQNWVEWKYVNIIKNKEWINEIIDQKSGDCLSNL